MLGGQEEFSVRKWVSEESVGPGGKGEGGKRELGRKDAAKRKSACVAVEDGAGGGGEKKGSGGWPAWPDEGLGSPEKFGGKKGRKRTGFGER